MTVPSSPSPHSSLYTASDSSSLTSSHLRSLTLLLSLTSSSEHSSSGTVCPGPGTVDKSDPLHHKMLGSCLQTEILLKNVFKGYRLVLISSHLLLSLTVPHLKALLVAPLKLWPCVLCASHIV